MNYETTQELFDDGLALRLYDIADDSFTMRFKDELFEAFSVGEALPVIVGGVELTAYRMKNVVRS